MAHFLSGCWFIVPGETDAPGPGLRAAPRPLRGHMPHALPTAQQSRIYLQFDRLPEPCRPALVVRENGAALLTVDPRSTKYDATRYCVDHLTPGEFDTYRAAFGGPPADQPAPESWVSDEPVDTFVPPALRLLPRRLHRSERSA